MVTVASNPAIELFVLIITLCYIIPHDHQHNTFFYRHGNVTKMLLLVIALPKRCRKILIFIQN